MRFNAKLKHKSKNLATILTSRYKATRDTKKKNTPLWHRYNGYYRLNKHISKHYEVFLKFLEIQDDYIKKTSQSICEFYFIQYLEEQNIISTPNEVSQ